MNREQGERIRLGHEIARLVGMLGGLAKVLDLPGPIGAEAAQAVTTGAVAVAMQIAKADAYQLARQDGKYTDDLLARKLKVPCPVCAAGVGERCFGRNKKRVASPHWDRAAAAKRAGFVNISKGGTPP